MPSLYSASHFLGQKEQETLEFQLSGAPQVLVSNIAHSGTVEGHDHGWRGVLAPAATSLARCPRQTPLWAGV